jgi:uncharacterized protein (DUF2062 family)
MSKPFLKRLVPDKDQIVQHPWMQRLGPKILHPRLWAFSRRGVAIGAALGVFFGFLIPVAQIPFTAAAAVFIRANIPAAAAGTLVTNPLTFAPIMISAHTIGSFVLGEELTPPPEGAFEVPVLREEDKGVWESVTTTLDSMGKPLIIGLVIMATGGGILTYFAVMLIWRVRTTLAWRKRKRILPSGE